MAITLKANVRWGGVDYAPGATIPGLTPSDEAGLVSSNRAEGVGTPSTTITAAVPVMATTGPGGGVEVSVGDISATIPELTAAQSAATLAAATSALTPVLTDVIEYVQGYYVAVGGTRTTGRSTPGDWSLENCYGAIQTAVNQGWTSDDWIVLDDGNWSMTYLSVTTTAALTGATLKVRSRSLDRDLCSLNFTDRTNAGIRWNRADKLFGLHARGIRVTSGEFTGATAVFLICNQPSNNLLFEEMDFCDASVNAPGNAGINGFFQIGSVGTRTVTFRRVRFYNLSANLLSNLWFMTGIAGCKVVFDDCDFGVPALGAITAQSNHLSSGFTGGVSGPLDAEFINCRQNGVTITCAATNDVACYPFVYITGSLTIDGYDIKNTTLTGGNAGVFGVMAAGPYSVKRLHATNCSSLPADTVNSVGGTFLAFSSNAMGSVEEVVSESCTSDFGTAMYWSQGASGVAKGVVAINCQSRVDSMVYSGGWGDTEAIGVVGVGCRYGTGSSHQALGGSGFFHAHNHTTLANRAKTAKYSHARLYDCKNADAETDGVDTIYAYNHNGTYAMTLEAVDIVADGSPGKQILLSQSNGATFTVSGDVAVPGGSSSVVVEGTITGGLNVTGDVQGFPRAPTREEAIAWARHVAGI